MVTTYLQHQRGHCNIQGCSLKRYFCVKSCPSVNCRFAIVLLVQFVHHLQLVASFDLSHEKYKKTGQDKLFEAKYLLEIILYL